MAHLLDTYSRTTGLRIGKMQTYEHFYPLPPEINRYAIILSGSGMPSKNYDYFNEVIRLLLPALEKEQIQLIQVGGNDDPKLNVNLNLCGITSKYQYAWLVKNASFVICNDTSALHLAGHYNVPTVSLFSVTDPKISGAWFGNKARYVTPFHFKPTFFPQEAEKSINTIAPENVAREVISLLSLDSILLENRESLSIGKKYGQMTFEVIPNQFFDTHSLGQSVLTLRLDLGGDLDICQEFLRGHRCNIVTKIPLNEEFILSNLQRLDTLIYEMDEFHNPDFVKFMFSLGIKCILWSRMDEEKLNLVKVHYMDYPPIHRNIISTKNDVKLLGGHSLDQITMNTKFRTHRFLLSMGKLYLSKAHQLADISVPQNNLADNEGQIIDNDVFWEDSEFYYLYN